MAVAVIHAQVILLDDDYQPQATVPILGWHQSDGNRFVPIVSLDGVTAVALRPECDLYEIDRGDRDDRI